MTPGALVTANQAAAMATVQQLDPIYVDVTQSSGALLALKRSLENGRLKSGTAAVRLVLEDGSVYPQAGTLQFSEVTVDPNTAAVHAARGVPEPARRPAARHVRQGGDRGRRDRPGRAGAAAGRQPRQHRQAGRLRRGRRRPARARALTTERAIGDQWLVGSGLKAGDRLIVEGQQKARPGQPVEARTATATAATPSRPPPARRRRGRELSTGRRPFMARFFIDRPIFAWVLAIITMLAGTVAVLTLPIAQYPSIAPPAIAITANYPGASSRTLEDTVTQVIEQKMKGLDRLSYIASTSESTGSVTITLTFETGTDPGHRAGAGPEQAGPGDAAAAAGGAAARPAGHQVGQQLPQRAGLHLRGRQAQRLGPVRLRRRQRAGPDQPGRGRRRHRRCSARNTRCGSGWTRTSSTASS